MIVFIPWIDCRCSHRHHRITAYNTEYNAKASDGSGKVMGRTWGVVCGVRLTAASLVSVKILPVPDNMDSHGWGGALNQSRNKEMAGPYTVKKL